MVLACKERETHVSLDIRAKYQRESVGFCTGKMQIWSGGEAPRYIRQRQREETQKANKT